MGILNLTEDSFYEGSRVLKDQDILKRAEKMLEDGADILDLGAYSTRPGADEVDEKVETERLTKAIKAIKGSFPSATVSADTFRSNVAIAAVDAGADIINDVGSGILDPKMFETVSSLKIPYILMHNRGTPKSMSRLTDYGDLVDDIVLDLSEKVGRLRELGLADLIIDPGFGFAKTIDQNFALLNRLDEFSIFNCPLLVGVSRKSMIWKTLKTNVEGALNGTTVLNTIALLEGAHILRVHDVKECVETIALMRRFAEQSSPRQV